MENEITINGQTYVLKPSPDDLPYCIIRTYSAGVHAGFLVRREGKEVELRNARRIFKWRGAATLSQAARDGFLYPKECLFPCEVAMIILTEAIEIIPCSEKAKNCIRNEVPEWEAK